MIRTMWIGYCIPFIFSLSIANGLKNNGHFPKDFLFGAATAAYQIEGGWNLDGKGPNIWDTFVHKKPSPIYNNDTGDVACDSYHRWKEDIFLAAEAGLQHYRFSISWSRVLPSGYFDEINPSGLEYYRNVIQEVLAYNMIPVVTIFHWDLPQKLADDGLQFTNPKIVDVFVDYARLIIRSFPEVGIWVTVNEPNVFCLGSYGYGVLAPGINASGTQNYQCSYVTLKAHAAVYHMYKNEFPNYKAKMAIVVNCQWYEPATNKTEDIEAADRQMQFLCGLYYHPIHIGDWPEVVKERVAERSLMEGYNKSRLPQFTPEEIETIKGTHDYLGINHYYTFLAANEPEAPSDVTSYDADVRVMDSRNPVWPEGSNDWAIVPWGARKILNWVRNQYGNVNILITEMGVSDNGTSLDDDERIDFYTDYLCEILEAIQIDGIEVMGVTAWALLDNFEWNSGYSYHFGIYYIDFYNDPNLTRWPKKSVNFFNKLTATRSLPCRKYNRNRPGPSWGPYGKHPKNYFTSVWDYNKYFFGKLSIG